MDKYRDQPEAEAVFWEISNEVPLILRGTFKPIEVRRIFDRLNGEQRVRVLNDLYIGIGRLISDLRPSEGTPVEKGLRIGEIIEEISNYLSPVPGEIDERGSQVLNHSWMMEALLPAVRVGLTKLSESGRPLDASAIARKINWKIPLEYQLPVSSDDDSEWK